MKRAIICEEAPIPIGPFSQAIIAQGEVLFVSGTIGLTNDGKLTEGLKNQAEQILKNIGAVLLQAEYTFAHVVKVNVFLTNMNDFAAMNEVYANYFTKPEPARTTIQVTALPLNAIIEIELTAIKPH